MFTFRNGVLLLCCWSTVLGCNNPRADDDAPPLQTAVRSLARTHSSHAVDDINSALFKSGDLIFRRGRSTESMAVLMIDRRTRFSHVGIIRERDGILFVVHALPGKSNDERPPLTVEPVRDFLDDEYATEAALYRLTGAYQHDYAAQAAEVAFTFVQAGVTFDEDFDLASEDKMYCTEFVWRAYHKAGLDLVDGKFEQRVLPKGKSPYLLPGTLIESPYLKAVYSIDLE